MNITLIEEKKHKNGDTTFTFDMDKEFKEIVKKYFKKKKFTQKLGKLFIVEAIHERLIQELDKAIMETKKLNKLK